MHWCDLVPSPFIVCLPLFACVTSVKHVEPRSDPQTIKTKIIHVFALFCMALFQLLLLLLVVDLVSLFPYTFRSVLKRFALLMYWNIWIGFYCRFFKKSRTNDRRRGKKTTRPFHMCEKKTDRKERDDTNVEERQEWKKAQAYQQHDAHYFLTIWVDLWLCVCLCV